MHSSDYMAPSKALLQCTMQKIGKQKKLKIFLKLEPAALVFLDPPSFGGTTGSAFRFHLVETIIPGHCRRLFYLSCTGTTNRSHQLIDAHLVSFCVRTLFFATRAPRRTAERPSTAIVSFNLFNKFQFLLSVCRYLQVTKPCPRTRRFQHFALHRNAEPRFEVQELLAAFPKGTHIPISAMASDL